MIVFDLKCGNAHVFEAWFASSDSYADQRARGLIACPTCGDAHIDKAVMAPNVAAKGNQRASGPAETALTPMATQPDTPEAALKAMMAMVAKAQAEALKTSEWVGRDFDKQARAMDAGEKPKRGIHGQTTPDEARALMEDGIAVMPLLVPVVPPEEQN